MPWTYYDKKQLPPMLRRRKLIGRRRIPMIEQEDAVHMQLRMSYAEIVSRVATATSWLRNGKLSVSQAWEVWETENCGMYLVPSGQETWHFRRDDRHFDEHLSPDAAGLCATELAINRMGNALPIFTAPRWLVQLESKLADFRYLHPEAAPISTVLD